MTRPAQFTIGIATSALFLWLALRNVELSAVGKQFLSTDPFWIAPFLISLLVFYALKSARWSLLLAPVSRIQPRYLFGPMMIGYAGTALLPMQMGELVRAYYASREFEPNFSTFLGSIFLERVIDLFTIIAVFGVILVAGQSLPNAIINAGITLSVLVLAAILLLVAFVANADGALNRIDSLLQRTPDRFHEGVQSFASSVLRGLGAIASPGLLARIVTNSVFQWGWMGVCIAISLKAVGIPFTLPIVAIVLVSTVIAISLPTSPGYIGNIQFAYVVSLQWFQVPASSAVAASVFYHILAYFSVLVIGGFYFARSHVPRVTIAEISQSKQRDC